MTKSEKEVLKKKLNKRNLNEEDRRSYREARIETWVDPTNDKEEIKYFLRGHTITAFKGKLQPKDWKLS